MNRALAVLLALATGQYSEPARAALFETDTPLSVVISAPLSDLTASRPDVEGTLSYSAEGNAFTHTLKLSLRGKSRLNECGFPPLRLDLKRKSLAGSLFEGQNKLKLVTQCRNRSKYLDYLVLEYGIYRLFNLITEQSLRVRWLDIVYRDEARNGPENVQPGFIIEDVGRAAERLKMVQHKVTTLAPADLDVRHATQVALFNFLIGNTDWSSIAAPPGDDCCHNGKPLKSPESSNGVVVLPYDFDQAGLINAEYARPGSGLPIRSVRTRLYRGLCRFNGQLPGVAAEFAQQREAMKGVFDAAKLSRGKRRVSSNYLNSFFTIINNPRQFKKQVLDRCRG